VGNEVKEAFCISPRFIIVCALAFLINDRDNIPVKSTIWLPPLSARATGHSPTRITGQFSVLATCAVSSRCVNTGRATREEFRQFGNGSRSDVRNAANQLSDDSSAPDELTYEPFQADTVSLVPLLWNVGRKLPNSSLVHRLCSRQCRFERFPARNRFVHAVVRVDATQGKVGKRPLAGIEAAPLVNERRRVLSASRRPAAEDRLPTVAVARPLIEHKNSGKAGDIPDMCSSRG